jgi:hypothetical protein
VYRGLLKSIEVPWLQCTIEIRGDETKGNDEMESSAYPFTPKTYPIDQVSTIDISRLLFARNGQDGRPQIALTPRTRCAKRTETIAC